MLCEYGCGNKANKKLKNGKSICGPSPASCPVNKRKNSSKVKRAYLDNRKDCKQFDGKRGWRKEKYDLKIDEVFSFPSNYNTGYIKERAIKENLLEYKCSICNLKEWLGESLVLELDHINGNNKDNRLKNIRLLCPNCHSQTANWRGRNANNSGKKVNDDEILDAYYKSKNIRQTLIFLNLTPKGKNYQRVKNLIKAE